MKDTEVKKVVRENYAKVVTRDTSGGGSSDSCCGGSVSARDISRGLGYSEEDLASIPEGSNLGLGCGNPVALASLQAGETVIDLGSGGGFDCFLAADKVGPEGRVIGVDMTPEMIARARENAEKGGYSNVEFRLGEIENLPVADGSADVIISNCVINLAPEKEKVFREAFRVLKPGGRVMVSDIVLTRALPESVMSSVTAYVGCISGAVTRREYLDAITAAGFRDVAVMGETSLGLDSFANDPTAQSLLNSLGLTGAEVKELLGSILSVKVTAVKPV